MDILSCLSGMQNHHDPERSASPFNNEDVNVRWPIKAGRRYTVRSVSQMPL